MIWLRLGRHFQTNACMFSKGKAGSSIKPPTPPFKQTAHNIKSPNSPYKKPINNQKVVNPKSVPEMAGSLEINQESKLQWKQKVPVVTIMGHVDHGKTTLIDYFRNSNIAAKQDGGITQRIGAFKVKQGDKQITFIDTPGHEAFINMRQRGANMTDLVVLVVAATEGVKNQTMEVINLILKMELKVVVAINKIDLPEANPQEIEQELERAGLHLEINGGNVPVVHISAKAGTNVDLLWELILEDTKEKKSPIGCYAQASVLEASQDKEGLNSMTIIIQRGNLKINSLLILGDQFFRVKTIKDDNGNLLKELTPGQAGRICGIPFIPSPGDQVVEIQNEKKATFIIEEKKKEMYESMRKVEKPEKMKAVKIKFERSRFGRTQKRAFCRGFREVWMNKFQDQEDQILAKLQELQAMERTPQITQIIEEQIQKLEDHKQYVYEYLKNTGESSNTLNFIMKFEDRGMEETIMLQLEKLKPSIEEETKIKLNLLRSDVGDVSISDIEESRNCSAKIFTFGAGMSVQARNHLTQDEQAPRTHKLIHNLLKDLKQTCFLKKIKNIKGVQRGRCEIGGVFEIKKKKGNIKVPGVKVGSGKISKNMKLYVFRNKIPISEGYHITFLKSFKKDVVELKKGEEGTIGLIPDLSIEIEKGDQIVAFEE